jgi:hypothetical protein
VTVRTPDPDAVGALITEAACEEVSSLEVRWIFPGRLEPAVAAWFGRFPATTESREDTYRMSPRRGELSVKIRGNRVLQVKSYRGGEGILEVPGRARGHMQAWHKWSFPISPPDPGRGVPAGWRRVRKRRRLSRLMLASDEIVACRPELRQEPGCDVELTEISAQGENWWSLGFEATGPSGLLRGELAATATLVFAQPVPAAEPGPDHFASYAQWLARAC